MARQVSSCGILSPAPWQMVSGGQLFLLTYRPSALSRRPEQRSVRTELQQPEQCSVRTPSPGAEAVTRLGAGPCLSSSRLGSSGLGWGFVLFALFLR